MWSILYYLRNNPEKLKESQRKRGLSVEVIDKAIEYDKKWRQRLTELNALRHRHNVISREIAKLKGAERGAKIREAKEILKKIEELEEEVEELKNKRDEILLSLPNIVDDDVPIGEDESDNVPIYFYGKPKVWRGHLKLFLEQTKGHEVEYEVIDWRPKSQYDLLKVLGKADT
ncbi:MAG: serine--tRNA ligase, partial [Thermoprotei archaeon]|nr:serine--tRNA ligase [Thermoprotei archaeon]